MARLGPRGIDIRRLIRFPRFRDAGGRASPSPSEGELLFELAGENPGNLLFGRFDEAEVRGLLERTGILEGISRRGVRDPLLRMECGDPVEQRVFLYAGAASRDRLLLEARLQLRRLRFRKPPASFPGDFSFRLLVIHWLELSDPDRPFPVDRPRLPGQRRPGLGILGRTLDLLRALGRELSLDGVLDVPDHFHTALFYSRAFRFLDPEVEGRFQAIVRDLEGVPLALLSEAVALGCLVDRTTGKPAPWEAAEQVLPVRGPLRRYLASPVYRRLRDRAFRSSEFSVDWDSYRAKLAARGRAQNIS